MVYTIIKSFEWDPRKAQANDAKHGVSFEAAITAFNDPLQWREPDLKHSTPHELRERLIGESAAGILMIVYTNRSPESVCRIISARKANRRDRRAYEQGKAV